MTTSSSTLHLELPQVRIQVSGEIAEGQVKGGTHCSAEKCERFIYCVPRALFALHFLSVWCSFLTGYEHSLIPAIVAPTASLQNPVTPKAKITLSNY